jgi:hypothetical protein
MTKHWIIKNHHDEFLIGFFANGRARWRTSDEPIVGSEALVYSTEDLTRVAIPALANAGVDVFTVERYS